MLTPSGGEKTDHSADYFSANNADAKASREQLAEESLESLIAWLKKEGNVGIMGKHLAALIHTECELMFQTRPTARTNGEPRFVTALQRSPGFNCCSSSPTATTLTLSTPMSR